MLLCMKELERLKSVLAYDPASGNFTWLVERTRYAGITKIGEIAGTKKLSKRKDGGYIIVGAFRKFYRAHRLAYWFMTGHQVPKGFEMDHINGNRADNRWENLRVVTRAQNSMNHKLSSQNISGTRGVSWDARAKRWLARITVNGKLTCLGIHKTLESAVAARREAELLYCGEYRRKAAAATA
jgi:hypothetical protein